MYNFLNPKLLPKIATETPAMDDYEASNLISDNLLIKSRGFLAYTTIKPPVDLVFELICPVHIHYIRLLTTIGNQKCTAIELEARTPSTTEYRSIGKSFFTTPSVTFCNNRMDPPPKSETNSHLAYFNRYAFRTFTNTSFIKVRILQTHRSVPCLGAIEIWGKPSKLCSPTTINSINRLINKTPEPSYTNTSKSASFGEDVFTIPDEFKDSLTFEVMSIPMTLPSGNTVDQSTLEKYISNEAAFGRQPCDPFTGVRFSEKCKPVFNVALKSRIDMFLLKNSEVPETFSIQRTVGKRKSNDVSYNVVTMPKVAKTKLDEDITKAMNSGSFICFSSLESTVTNNSCLLCNVSEVSYLYISPCNHLYCRKCLTKTSNQLACRKCDKLFSKNDVKKFHTSVLL